MSGINFNIERAGAYLTKKLPFGLNFGLDTSKGVPKLIYWVKLKANGKSVTGVASDFAMKKWFDKGKDEPVFLDAVKKIAAKAIHTAKEYYDDKEYQPFHFSQERGDTIRALHNSTTLHETAEQGTTRLAAQEVYALEERAILDALSRAYDKSAVDFIRDNQGFDFKQANPEFSKVSIEQILRSADDTPSHLKYRHTVSLDYPVYMRDRQPDADGKLSPTWLRKDVGTHGMNRFKIKFDNDVPKSIRELKKMEKVIKEKNGNSYVITLDGNEAFAANEWGKLERFVKDFKEKVPHMAARTEYIEQPFHRDALKGIDDEGMEVIRRIENDHKLKILIDESGDSHDSYQTAISKDIKGTSMKGCKGIFHAIYDAALSIAKGVDHFVTAEDLTVLEPSDLLQNLEVFGRMQKKGPGDTIGVIEDAELNGAFNTEPGLYLTLDQRKQIAADMPNLYTMEDDKLKIVMPDGKEGYSLEYTNQPGLGAPKVYFNPDDMNDDMVKEIASVEAVG